jgi:hypothetical protein
MPIITEELEAARGMRLAQQSQYAPTKQARENFNDQHCHRATSERMREIFRVAPNLSDI